MSFVARRCVGRAWSVLVGTSLALAGLSCVPEVIGAPPEVGAVVVAGAPERLYVGSEVVLSTTITDTRGLTLTQEPVTWSSSNASIAAVDAQGRVRGIGAGTVTITATAGGKGTPVPLTVLERVASVAVTATRPSVVAGDSVQLTANPRDVAGTALTGRAVTWASNDTLIATVSSAGLVTTKAYFGPATRPVSITATSEGQSGTLNLSVAPVPVGAVVVSSDSATIEPTANQRLNATVRSASGESLTGRSITWSTTDTSVAVVSDSGLVTARAYLGGTTRSSRIIVTSEGKADTAVVVVTPLAVSTVSLQGAPADSVLLLGGSVSLLPQLKSGAGQTVTDRQVTWVSSAPAVATVSVSGVVTPVNAGTAVITASSEGKSASATLLVRAPLAVPAPLGL